MLKSVAGLLTVLLVSSLIAACSGPLRPSLPYDGLARTYEPGTPNFDAQVQPSLDGTRRGLQVDVSAPELTFIFRRSDAGLAARVEWLVRLMTAEGRRVVDERSHRETIERETTSIPTLFRRSTYSTFLEAQPGRYIVEISLEDLSSGKTQGKELVFDLPARNQPLIATELRLESASGRPLVELFLPDVREVRRAVFFMTGNVQRPVRLHYELVKLDADTSSAQSPYWQGPGGPFAGLNPPPFSIADTVFTEYRNVQRGALRRIVFPVPDVGEGTYRAEVEIEDLENEGDPPAVVLSRYFIVRRPDFPLVEGFDQLIPPLIYLADAPEWERLDEARGTREARSQFDRFWGRYMQDREQAARIVHTFFSRVEEANLRYSSYKEGWKTDRGMVFIILGEPLFVERTLESEIWYYSYDEGRGERTFVFNRVWRDESPDVINEFRLERSFDYERFWRGEISRWRSGQVS